MSKKKCSNKYLILQINGLMQSWGSRSNFDNRDTETLPTKSGIIGMICNALGIERNDVLSISELQSLHMMSTCIGEGTVFVDFHTVGHGYGKRSGVINAIGDKKKMVVTKRQYLCGYHFLVALYGKCSLIDKCSDAIKNPIRSLYLGRKCCIPSCSPFLAICDTKEELHNILMKNGWEDNCRTECEVESNGIIIMDVPLDFSKRKFTSRMISGDTSSWL